MSRWFASVFGFVLREGIGRAFGFLVFFGVLVFGFLE